MHIGKMGLSWAGSKSLGEATFQPPPHAQRGGPIGVGFRVLGGGCHCYHKKWPATGLKWATRSELLHEQEHLLNLPTLLQEVDQVHRGIHGL